MNRPIKSVIFDWDRTLAHTGPPGLTLGRQLSLMFELADLPYSRSEIEAALELYQQDVTAGRKKAIVHPQTRREIGQFYGYLFDYLGEEDKSWPALLRLYGTYALLPTHLFEDSRPAMRALQKQGFELGILSNHSGSARPIMEKLVGDMVPSRQIVISEEIGVHKPAKTTYRRAASSVRTPAEACILVGDNFLVDAVGAVSAGGYGGGIWLDRHNQGAEASMPDRVERIQSLSQLPALLSAYGP